MSAYRYSSHIFTACAALILAGCSGAPKQLATNSSEVVASSAVIAEITALLDQGEVRSAKKRISRELKTDPMNPSLLVLRQGIAGDAKDDLGSTSFPYKVKPGETMGDLAGRFLGNRLKFYQLARYNDITVPAKLEAGQVLRIPGHASVAAPSPPSSQSKSPSPPRVTDTKRTAPSIARPEADPAGAQKARSAGLTALNQGKVRDAVTLLRRAAALDPQNATISKDLARAERIAATVRKRQ